MTWLRLPRSSRPVPTPCTTTCQTTGSYSERVGAENGDVNHGVLTGAKEIRGDLPLAVPDARHDLAVVRGRGCSGRQGHGLVGSQAPFITRNGIARLLGMPDENVHFIYREGSGCFRAPRTGRCTRGRSPVVAGRGSTGAGAVDAGRRARWEAEGSAPGHHAPLGPG